MCYTLVTTGTMLTGAMLCHILLLDTLQPWNHRFYQNAVDKIDVTALF